MANKTRSDIRTFIEYYLGESTDYETQINTLIDAAVEDISYKYNFNALRGMAEATLAADAYYVSAPTDFKESIMTFWLLSSTGESGKIRWRGEKWYHERFQYPDYSDRGTGTPKYFTKIGDYLYFNCKADQAYTIRTWYQKFHQDFTTLAAGGTVDDETHLFKPNILGMMTIASWVLTQMKQLLPLPQEAVQMADQYAFFLGQLIDADSKHADEPMDFEAYFDADRDERFTGGGITTIDPYDWTS